MIIPAMGTITFSDSVLTMLKMPEFHALADLLCNRAYLVIDIGKHGVEVAKYPPFEYILYELSNFIYNAAHLSYENSVESCGITVCATMIMPPPDISCLMPCDFAPGLSFPYPSRRLTGIPL